MAKGVGGGATGDGGDPGGPQGPDGPGGPGGPETSTVGTRHVVREDAAWKERAEAAEARVKELESRVEELESEVEAAQEEASAAREMAGHEQRRGEIERRLREAGAVDLPTAMLLAEIELAGEDSPGVEGVVRALRESKPYLFRGGGSRGRSSAMSVSASGSGGVDLGSLAEAARESGDRTALLRYLRGRRAV